MAALAFSWNNLTKLGGRLFNTAQPVRDHIVAELESVAAKHEAGLIRSEFQGEDREGDFEFMIVRQPDMLFVFNDNEEEFYSHFNDPANPYGKCGDSTRMRFGPRVDAARASVTLRWSEHHPSRRRAPLGKRARCLFGRGSYAPYSCSRRTRSRAVQSVSQHHR